jgi:galactose mutarotase-like enzyme
MGIPFLHPWANRLECAEFEVAGRGVELDLPGLSVKRDGAGLPMHGLLTAARGWKVERHGEVEGGGVLAAGFDFGAYPGLTAAFPFPHRVELEATLRGPVLTIVTTLRNDGEADLPVSFGFHPYLRLPGVGRGEWMLEAPVRERLELDRRQLPTGRRLPGRIEPGPLGSRRFDDAYLAPPGGEPFALSGGGRRVELRLGPGYRFAQIFTPGDSDAVAFEPMTAPTNALVAGGPDLPLISPGESFAATFSITVG